MIEIVAEWLKEMKIATIADWATFLAIAFTPIFGGVWWWWTKRKKSQWISRDLKEIQKFINGVKEVDNELNGILTEDTESEMVKVGALLVSLSGHIDVLRLILLADIMQTHSRPSEMPSWLNNIQLQWPIAKRSSSA